MSRKHSHVWWPFTRRLLGCLVALVCAPTLVGAAQAEEARVPAEPTLSPEELKLLEASVQAAQAEATSKPATPSGGAEGASSANPDIAFILDTALAVFSDPENLQGGGHDPTRTGFNLQQLELSIQSNVDPYFSFRSNLVFSQFGVEIEEVYATTLSLPHNLQVRAGQFLTRFGRLNPTHPHSWSFVDLPLVNAKFFGSEGNRGLGTEVSYLSPLPWYAELSLSATDAAGGCCARSFYGNDDLGVTSPLDVLYTGTLKQFFPLNEGLGILWGLSGQLGPNASGLENRSQIVGTDLYIRYKPVNDPNRNVVSLEVEAMHRARQVPFDRLVDYGGRAQLTWQWRQHYELGVRAEAVSGVAGDPLDPDWNGWRTRYTGQLTTYPSHFSRLRLQGSVDLPSWREQPIWATFLALEVLVGAHGAHTF